MESLTFTSEGWAIRHPASDKFHRYLDEIAALHDAKSNDYGVEEDPLANVRASADWGVPAWIGTMIRLSDKVKRLQALARTGKLSNEGAVDSFNDLAAYALLARILYEEEVG